MNEQIDVIAHNRTIRAKNFLNHNMNLVEVTSRKIVNMIRCSSDTADHFAINIHIDIVIITLNAHAFNNHRAPIEVKALAPKKADSLVVGRNARI